MEADTLTQDYNALLERLEEDHKISIEVTKHNGEWIAGAYLHNGTYGIESYPYSDKVLAERKANELREKWIEKMLDHNKKI